MAIAIFPDCRSVPYCFACKSGKSLNFFHNPHSICCRNGSSFPLLMNWSSRSVKTSSSACSSSLILEKDPSIYDPPAIHGRVKDLTLSSNTNGVDGRQLGLKLQESDQSTGYSNLSENSEELNAAICELFKDPSSQELAFECYQKAKQNRDFRPQRYTIKLVIRYLARNKNWDSLLSFCDDIKVFRVSPGKSAGCSVIAICVKARKFKLVDILLENFVAADVKTAVFAFDSAMRGYNQLHMYNSTTVLHQRMKSYEIALDTPCYYRVMEAHLKMKHYEKVVEIFQEIENRKLAEVGRVPSPYFSQVYLMLCESLGKLRRPFEALEFFREMSKKGVPVSHLIYASLISSFASAGEVKLAEELLEEAEARKMLRDPALFFNLVLMYVKEGLLEKTLGVAAVMGRVNMRVSDCIFCTIVNGFSKKRGLKAALRAYHDLLSRGCDPGQVTYASILNVYCRLGRYSEAEALFSEMERKGFDNCVVAYSSMIAAYGKMGRVSDAMKLVAKMKEKGCEPNVWTYNSLLDMHGKALNIRAVEKTWKEMKRRRVSPDKVSYTAVISAYNRVRELEICIEYYKEFRLTGAQVDRAMAGIMVAVFSKMNRVDELVELLQDMKVQGTKLDARFYHSALSALRDAGLQSQAKQLQESFKVSS